MLQPPGLEHLFNPGKVLRLKRQVYGLSQSGRVFYKLLAATMCDFGFKSVTDDDCVWRLKRCDSESIMATVVDDMIQVTNDDALLKEFNDFLRSRFTITDNGGFHQAMPDEVQLDRSASVSDADAERIHCVREGLG
eukprot:3770888-Rhodomonas_salina.1